MEELENKETTNNEVNLQDELNKIKASLNYERSERKRLEKELKASKEDDTKAIEAEEARIRAKLANGKSALSDDVIDDIMGAIGKEQAKANVRNAKQNIERDILELKRNPEYIDVEEYGDEIRELMRNGLSAERAYWAVAGATKLSNSKAKATKEEEKEQHQKETRERANQGYVDTKPAGEEKKEQYSARERAMAQILGKSVEEVHARNKNVLTLSEIVDTNKKFKKGE